MNKENTNSGIDPIGDMPWGTHFCSFFKTKEDLLEIVVPFIKTGLENNEFCIWVTAPPLTIDEATHALKQKMKDLDVYIKKQSIEIIEHSDLYLKEDIFTPQNVITRWNEKFSRALDRGYIGMRVNASEGWLDKQIWKDFINYEMMLNTELLNKPIIVLCCYSLEKCTASGVLDVSHVHEMVVSKRDARWEILESPELKKTKKQLNKINQILEGQVQERTRELEAAIINLKKEITANKKTEKKLAKIAEDLIQRTTDLQQFTYIVSHNLRAPVANILGLSNVLKSNSSIEERNKIQQFLFNAVEQLDEIVRDLNKILQTRVEITENKQSVYLPELLNNIKGSIRNLIEKENVQLLTDFSEIDKITTIKSYIHSIFHNLILNSIKYKHPDKAPVIYIKSIRHKGKIKISFKDNGIGIDLQQHKEQLFGLYKRFHLNVEGKGIGLFMVKTQVEILGGKISVKSEPNAGTEFTIELPV